MPENRSHKREIWPKFSTFITHSGKRVILINRQNLNYIYIYIYINKSCVKFNIKLLLRLSLSFMSKRKIKKSIVNKSIVKIKRRVLTCEAVGIVKVSF